MFKPHVSSVSSSTSLLPLHSDIRASLFTPEGQPYLLEVQPALCHFFRLKTFKETQMFSHSDSQVMFAMRELSGPLSLLIEMVTYCSYCNEPFSLEVLQLLKV